MKEEPKDRKIIRRENLEYKKQRREYSDETRFNKQSVRSLKNRKQQMKQEELWEDWEDEVY